MALRSPYGWALRTYDRTYRYWHGLDRPGARIGPVLRLEVRPSRRTLRLSDGAIVRPADRVGMVHLDNDHVAALHANGARPITVGLDFRRDLIASLRMLAALAAEEGPLARVPAFGAVTIFHRPLRLLGFERDPQGLKWPRVTAAYLRALLASLHPLGRLRVNRPAYRRAERLWISREMLLARYGSSTRRAA